MLESTVAPRVDERTPPSTAEPPAGRRPPWAAWLRTVALYAVTLWAVVTVVFLLPRLLPGDPLSSLDAPDSGSFVVDPQARARVEAYYGLDRPLLDQYRTYLSDLAHGDLGWSIAQNTPVASLIGRRLPWTLLLMGSAMALASVISFVAGVAAAWRRGGVVDRALIVTLATARAVPEYAMATVLLVCFAVLVPWFPQSGAQTPFADYSSPYAAVSDVLHHLALPLTALTLALAANNFLVVRNTVVSTLGEDYMLLARAKGLPPRLQKYRHSGRNALLPFLTSVGGETSRLAAGAVLFVEAVFVYPGMGTLLNGAVSTRDYPLLQGGFVVLAVLVLVVNAVVELAYTSVDPRVAR